MKKKLFVLLVTGMVAASSITACGSKKASTETTTAVETTTTAEETTTTAEETSTTAETTTAGESETTAVEGETKAANGSGSFLDNYDTYLSWTGKEWKAASKEEKQNAAIACSVYMMEVISGEELNKEDMAAGLDAAKASGQVDELVKQLDDTLEATGMTLKEFADFAAEQVGGAN